MDTQVGIQAKAQTVTISPKEFSKLRECRKVFSYDRIGLRYKGYEDLAFVRGAIAMIKAMLLSSAEAEIRASVESYFDGYDKNWFSCEKEWESAKKNALKKVMRLCDYIQTRRGELSGVDVAYSSYFCRPLNYRGMQINGIAGVFDLVLEKHGHKTLVVFHYGAPTESRRARKKENLPENSPELIAATCAARMMFGTDFHVELWYIRNKDDNGTQIVDKFEHREGKNIIGVDFSSFTDEALLKKLFETLNCNEKCHCADCRHQCVCKAETEIRSSYKEAVSGTKRAEVKLTEAQKEVVNHVNGPLCVVAVPGAGKTESLVQRMIHLIRDVHVKPQKILFVTFTKKAAREISSRVEAELLNAGIKGMPQIMTYNALGFSILKDNPLYVGRRIKLAEDTDRYTLISKAYQEVPAINGISYLNPNGEHGIVRFLDTKFDEIEANGKESFVKQYSERYDVEGILRVYDAYKREYDAAGFIDYDDQISMVNDLFDQYKVLPGRYAEKYEFIMVDEFQDSSEEQVEMIYAIARCHNNLVVVGDDDQSIYAWRGGSSDYMLEFSYDFPAAKTVYMEDNFRSNGKILDLCSAWIAGNGKRYEKKLVSHSEADEKPVYYKDVTPQTIAELVTGALSEGLEPGDIAVLARNNKRLEEVTKVLDGVCKVSIPKDYMIEDVVFTTIYDVMTLFYKGLDEDVAFYRYLKMMGLESYASKNEKNDSLYANLVASGVIPAMTLSAECLDNMALDQTPMGKAMYTLLSCFEKLKYGQLKEAVKFIAKEVMNLDEHLVVENLSDMAEEKGIVKIETLYSLMGEMISFGSTERVGYDTAANAVNLLTAHDSKGKEFKVVIIYGMEDFDMTEEEKRVLYVAMSRAKNKLFMIETAYNKFEGFDRVASYVSVKGGI